MLGLFKIGILFINFKLLISVFITDFIIAVIPVVAFTSCLIIKFFNTSLLQFIRAGWLFFFILLHALVSFFYLNPDLPVNYLIAGGGGYLYISLYAWILLLMTKKEITAVVLFVMKLIYFALFVFVIEKILPNGEFHNLSNFLQSSKHSIDIAGESYRENILGMSFERYGTVYFEPLTAALIITSAYVLLSDIWQRKSLGLQILLKVAVTVSFVKSAYLIVVFSKISGLLKGYKYLLVLIPVAISIYFALTRIDLAGFERIEGFESIGNHLIGLYYGALAGYDKSLFGNGVGTAGYNVYLEALRRNELGPFESLNDFSVLKNGNESALGIILYQFGLLNTVVALVPILCLPVRNSFKIRDHTSVGYFFSLFAVSALTESILSVVILTMILPMIFFRLKCVPAALDN